MSLSDNFPDINPSLLLDFANTKQLDPRITFTRASTAAYYDGVTVAKAEENLLIRSQEFDNAAWIKTGSTVTANSTTAPDGNSTADTLTASAGTSDHQVVQNVTTTVGQDYVVSVYAKAGTNNYIQLAFFTQTGSYANFDITSGAGVIGTSAGVISTSIQDVGNNWYRCSVILNSNTPFFNSVVVALANSSSMGRLVDWTAAGTETVYIWGAQLEQRSAVTAYTPTTTQPITNYIPVLKTAASGEARFDHDPITGESKGLLIEEQRTNLLLRSAEFDNAAWVKTRSSITANTIVAPDGTLTGDKLVEDSTASNTHYVITSNSVTSGISYTYSVYVKAGGRSQTTLGFIAQFPANANATFDFTTGTVTSNAGLIGSSITNVGNGWYRFSITATANATGAGTFILYLTSGGNISYTGDGYSGIYIWGAQLEVGAFPTSYIPTVAASVTRNADAASMTGTNFSSWYRQDEGTLYAEASFISVAGGDKYVADINDGTTNNRISALWQWSGNTQIYSTILTNGSNVAQSTNNATVVAGTPYKNASAVKTNDFAVSFNGGSAATDTSLNLPVVNRLSIGSTGNGTLVANANIRKLAYYPQRLTNDNLQALTS